MKIRTGFVSNSSSSSFLLAKKNYDGPASILYRNYGDVLGDAEDLEDQTLTEELKTRHKNGEFLGYVTVPYSLLYETDENTLLEIFRKCGLEKLSIRGY